jgi:hypothetical protein
MIRPALGLGATLVLVAGLAAGQDRPVPNKERPVLLPAAQAEFDLQGPVGARLRANVAQWLLAAPRANPAMLQMLRDRDRSPRRDLVPWAGEFAGKYLISAVQAYRLTRDQELKGRLRRFVSELIAAQDADGYFGPFPRDQRMTGKGLWDLWGQYHVMLGLYLWDKEVGEPIARNACRKCADYFCRYFLDENRRVLAAGSEEMNQSCLHVLALLYRDTGEPRYLRLMREIEQDWATPPSGDYVRTALAGVPFHKTPKPRWESLHAIQGIAELAWLTGDERYRRAFEHIWWSILEGDRHSTGGFSSGEQATGNPYDPKPIETCCTVAWAALTLDYLRLTGDCRAADELELSLWNAVLGAQHPSGRWWTYNTPMDGERKASAHDIVFQARAGSPELNCCSVNGPRGLGQLADWAVMTTDDGLAVNYYGPGRIVTSLPSGKKIELVQKTDYPRTGVIVLGVTPPEPTAFTLHLRIPGWSRRAVVAVQGKSQGQVNPGQYLEIDRTWNPGDTVTLTLDMGPWLWAGERESAGKAALYHGPVLLAYDPRFDRHDPLRLPTVDVRSEAVTQLKLANPPLTEPHPFVLVRWPMADGGSIVLCDFATAGAAGNRYASWLPATGLRPVSFSRKNPLRAQWLTQQ